MHLQSLKLSLSAFKDLLYKIADAGLRAGKSVAGRRQALVMGLTVTVEPAGGNSRCCFAGIEISAPVECVWSALTNYEGLGDFIPGAVRLSN